jgi:hypothetical protein
MATAASSVLLLMTTGECKEGGETGLRRWDWTEDENESVRRELGTSAFA